MFAYLFRNRAQLKKNAQACLDLLDEATWLRMPGSTASGTLEKELCETFAVLQRLEEARLLRLPEAVVLDVAAGKGFTSLAVRDVNSQCAVVAIDLFKRINPLHLALLRERRVETVPLDLLHNNGSELLRLVFRSSAVGVSPVGLDNFSSSSRESRAALADGVRAVEARVAEASARGGRRHRPVAVVSVHPCGLLASVVVDAFVAEARPGDWLIVVPCCSPPGASSRLYRDVCDALFARVPGGGRFRKTMDMDGEMKTDKNCVISVVAN